jgi:D-3-phosphoglycerate dehydrogenase
MTEQEPPTVVVADHDFGEVDIERGIIERAGFRLVAADCKTEDDVIAAARNADAVFAQYATVGARAIAAFTRCRVIARYGTGVDIVDVDAATRHGILVTNVPNDWCRDEVADHAMALLLAAARRISTYDRATRAGVWRWQSGEPIHRMQGRLIGLLSFGAIAQAIAVRARAFGMGVIAHDPYLAPAEITAHGATPVSFDELLDQSDYLVVQAPLTDQTRHLIGEPELRRMKSTLILVNAALSDSPVRLDADATGQLLMARTGWSSGSGNCAVRSGIRNQSGSIRTPMTRSARTNCRAPRSHTSCSGAVKPSHHAGFQAGSGSGSDSGVKGPHGSSSMTCRPSIA